MDRREFLKAAVGTTLVGGAVSPSSGLAAAPAVAKNRRTTTPEGHPKRERTTPKILTDYTAEDHRRRLENIAVC